MAEQVLVTRVPQGGLARATAWLTSLAPNPGYSDRLDWRPYRVAADSLTAVSPPPPAYFPPSGIYPAPPLPLPGSDLPWLQNRAGGGSPPPGAPPPGLPPTGGAFSPPPPPPPPYVDDYGEFGRRYVFDPRANQQAPDPGGYRRGVPTGVLVSHFQPVSLPFLRRPLTSEARDGLPPGWAGGGPGGSRTWYVTAVVPPPPVPVLEHAGHFKPFVERVPELGPRVARFTEKVSQVLNSLMGSGQLFQSSPGVWVLDAGLWPHPGPAVEYHGGDFTV